MRDKGAQPLGFSLLAALSNLPAERIYNQDLQNVGALEYLSNVVENTIPGGQKHTSKSRELRPSLANTMAGPQSNDTHPLPLEDSMRDIDPRG